MKKPGTLIRLDAIGRVIDSLEEKHSNQEIKGIIVLCVNKDGSYDTFIDDDLSYIEVLGYVESVKSLVEFV